MDRSPVNVCLKAEFISRCFVIAVAIGMEQRFVACAFEEELMPVTYMV